MKIKALKDFTYGLRWAVKAGEELEVGKNVEEKNPLSRLNEKNARSLVDCQLAEWVEE